jgi:hypothetical protein
VSGKVLTHLEIRSKILPRPLTGISAVVGFCTGKNFAVGNFIQVAYRAPHPKISKLTFDALLWA